MTFQILNDISTRYGGFSLSDYFERTGRKYSIFIIDYEQRDIMHQDGVYSDALKAMCLEGLHFAHGSIWASYGIRTLPPVIDVFMFRSELVELDDIQLRELLVFHEICHFLEKTGFYQELGLEFSDDEVRVGNEVQTIANRIDNMTGGWGDDKDHNPAFGSILFHYLKQFDFPNRFHLMGRAMIKNFGENCSGRFEQVAA